MTCRGPCSTVEGSTFCSCCYPARLVLATCSNAIEIDTLSARLFAIAKLKAGKQSGSDTRYLGIRNFSQLTDGAGLLTGR